ncbi:MAG: hypothetical protein A3C35_04005 [Omnitrophica bacterium RIFCSPHIGHO2_02_FULL_46_11]|nr:MAG: hypothetical protein A3C35_04005 [Omnitrophica bacterium RIFCSPHIGHO2_02_FULL_46_11]
MRQKIKAVFFDAGGTLFRPFPSVGEIYARTASTYGTSCNPEILEREFYSAWQRRGGLASLGSETNEEKERTWWYGLVREVFESHGGMPRFDEFFAALHRSFEEKHLWEIYPEVVSVLKELRKRGLTLGIVSNWDLRLQKVVKNLGLISYFHFLVSSSVCGATKPSPKIFKEALKKAGVKPEETIHVGDTYEEDFVGAKSLGIQALLLNRNGNGNSAPPELRISSLEELYRWI